MGGGLCTYIRSDLNFEVLGEFTVSNTDIETLVVKLNNEQSHDMFVINLYRPPSGNCDTAIEHLRHICNELSNPAISLDIVLAGDINIDCMSRSHNSELLHDLCLEFNLTSQVSIPTRTTQSSSTCLDVILSNTTHVYGCGIISNCISDHSLVYLVKKKIAVKHSSVSFQGRSYKDFDEEIFHQRLRSHNSGRYYAAFDVETAWHELFTCILYESDIMYPIKTFKFKDKEPEWFNDELIE